MTVLGMDDGISDAESFYACCECCTHDPGFEPDRHTIPCPNGCNEGQEAGR